MKNTNKLKSTVRELAEEFNIEFNSAIPFKILPDKSLIYKNYLVKQNRNGYWSVYDVNSKNIIHEFFLKTCALLAAKQYYCQRFDIYGQIKNLDRRYQAHYSDIVVYQYNIAKITDPDQHNILENKLHECRIKAKSYQQQISRMFKCTFV